MDKLTPSCQAMFITAPASGQGKTTLTAALARLLVHQGKRVQVFKTGPDFIDPMIHAQASGLPCYQLDLWMLGEEECHARLFEAAQTMDVILIEGVMGLFDGNPSSADLAKVFGIPVVAVLDASAMAQTFGAIAFGLAHYDPALTFAGVLANRVASDGHGQMIAQSLHPSTPLLGLMKQDAAITLPDRHLGLLPAQEISELDALLDKAAQSLARSAQLALHPLALPVAKRASLPPLLTGVTIAIARDTAFCFLYPANVDALTDMGAELVYFSPLTDQAIPPCDALYLPGGYPELHLEALSENYLMHEAIRTFHTQGKPIYAECGGMMYLCESIENKEGKQAPMVKLLKATAQMQPRLANLGMHTAPFPSGELRGHSFHYSLLSNAPCEVIAHTRSQRLSGKSEAIYQLDSLTASYFHAYFYSNPHATAGFFR